MSISIGGKHFLQREPATAPKLAVSIGGGTGQPNAIKTLHAMGYNVCAVVSMVDNGGSTGILRERAGMVPPGDVRKCLSAMAKDPDSAFAKSFEHRFSYADNHTLGNLMLTALTEETGSFAEAIAICGQHLDVYGRVYPSTLENVNLSGVTIDGMEVEGQVNLGEGPSALERVWLTPKYPEPYGPALEAIEKADVILLGPGSLFTSVIPNLLVPGIIEAIKRSSAQVIFVCSMADMQGETWGLSADEHVEALLSHGMRGLVDVVLLHKNQVQGIGLATRSFRALTGEEIDAHKHMEQSLKAEEKDGFKGFIRPVNVNEEIVEKISQEVPLVLVRDFSVPERPTWHNQKKLADVLKGVIQPCHLPQK